MVYLCDEMLLTDDLRKLLGEATEQMKLGNTISSKVSQTMYQYVKCDHIYRKGDNRKINL